jgi:phosphate:Na+ symporter
MDISNINLWPVLAGLGLFLYGMNLLEQAIRLIGGRNFKKFLRRHTKNPVKAVFSGTLFTLILQSSSMVTLLVMSFAGAGIIGLRNGIGMVLGANLGTTLKGWVISLIGFKLNIGELILPFLAFGAILSVFAKNEKVNSSGKILLGISLLFLGLDFMKNGFEQFALNADLSFLQNKPGIFLVLVGALLSGSIQSSSASMMIFLSSYSAGLITLEQGFYLVIGGDLGTTVTAIIGSIGGNTIKKKVGLSQFLFNGLNAIVAFSLASVYAYIIANIFKITDGLVSIVAFHSLLNLVGILLIVPFIKPFTSFIDNLIKPTMQSDTKFIDKIEPNETEAAIEALEKEAKLFVYESLAVSKSFLGISLGSTENINIQYNRLKAYEAEITKFYIKIQQKSSREEDQSAINGLVAAVRNAGASVKDIKDIKHNLDELKNVVSDSLFGFYEKIKTKQNDFYSIFEEKMLKLNELQHADIEELNLYQSEIFKSLYEKVFELFENKQKREIDLTSLLNMVRELNNANESLIKALNNLQKAKIQLVE